MDMGTEVEVLVRDNCPLCDEAVETVETVVDTSAVSLEITNVDKVPALKEMYGDEVPVIMIDGIVEFRLWVEEDELINVLEPRFLSEEYR